MEEITETQTAEMPTFAWTLDRTLYHTTIFSKKKMVEMIDIKKIYGFIKAEMGISYVGISRYNSIATTYKTELEQMIKFKELYNRKLKKFQTAFSLPKHKWGRINPANYLSLSILHRPTRHSLCEDNYIDLDMINAQPTIINEICKMNGTPCDWLSKYVKNPKKYREFIMGHHKCSKDVAKNLPIILMFGGSYDTWIKENSIIDNDAKEQRIKNIVEIENEMKCVIEIVYNANPLIKKDVLKQDATKWRNESEAKRGVMALWSQSIERMLQETAITWLCENKGMKVEDVVPSQDGFMILKEYWYEGIIEDLNNVMVQATNIAVKYIAKPFDEAIEIPSYDDEKTFDEWEDLLSAKKLADRFIEEFNNFIVKNGNNLYLYWGETDKEGNIMNGRWYDETDEKKRYKLTLYISEDLYNIVAEELNVAVELDEKSLAKLLKMLRDRTSKGGNMSDIIKHILPKARQTEEDFNSNPFLLGFNNGVYDLLKDEFRDYAFNDYITLTTKYDYQPPDYENEEIFKIRTELVEIFETIQPDPDNRILFLQVLASGLDGRAYQKLFLFNGQGGNGKGLTGSLMDTTLGEYYHQPSNGILKDVEKSNSPSPDMFNLKNKRYINFKEVAGSIRVAMLRNLTGGGKFSGRLLNQNPEQFFMSGTFVMEFNNAPELDGKPQRADYRRLLDMDFPINFTDDPSKIDKVIGGILFKKANTYYETQEFLQKARPVFLDMLLGVYRAYKDTEGSTGMKFVIPASIRKRTEVFIENQNLFQKVFNDLWKKVEIEELNTEDEKKKTKQVKEIWESILASEEHRRLSYRDKRQYGRDEFYKWIAENFVIEGNSKTGKIIKGIVRKTDMDDEEDEVEIDDGTDGETDGTQVI